MDNVGEGEALEGNKREQQRGDGMERESFCRLAAGKGLPVEVMRGLRSGG